MANNVTAQLTALKRLELLLPWLNGDGRSYEDTRERLWEFLGPPTPGNTTKWETSDSGFTRASLEPAIRGLYGHEDATGATPPVSPAELERLRVDLRRVLDGEAVGLQLSLSVRPSDRPRHGAWRNGKLSPAARKATLGAGHYVVHFEATGLHDTVLYLFMRLLTAPGAATLARCPAPLPGKRHCEHWFVAIGPRRGRPARFCSDACRMRFFRKPESEPKTGTVRRRVRRGG